MAGRKRYRDFTVEDAWNGKGSEEVEEKRAQLFFGKKKKKKTGRVDRGRPEATLGRVKSSLPSQRRHVYLSPR